MPPSLGDANAPPPPPPLQPPGEFHVSRIANKQKKDHTVTKVTQSLQEPDGFRMDVTLWFRHKNEAQFYVDSVGQVHKTDQNHSTQLGNVEHSSVFVPGTKMIKESETLSEISPIKQNFKSEMVSETSDRHQQQQQHHHLSMSALDQSHRELDRLLMELQQGAASSSSRRYEYMGQDATTEGSRFYRQQQTTSSTSFVNSSPYEQRSMQQVPGYRPPPSPHPRQQARYTTKLTREYSSRQVPLGPVTVKVDAAPLTVNNSSSSSSAYRGHLVSEREKQLVDELLQARLELAQLKRTHSLMDTDIYRGTSLEQQQQQQHHTTTAWEATNMQTNHQTREFANHYGSRNDFQTRPGRPASTLERQRHHSTGVSRSESEFRHASALLPKKPFRTMSSNQVFDTHTRYRGASQQRPYRLQSESAYESRTNPVSSYSAHQETLKQQQVSQHQQYLKQQQISSEQRYMEKPSEIFEEIETITLQPIGRGVQDLETATRGHGTMPRTPRATTPLSTSRSQAGFSTLPNQRNNNTIQIKQQQSHSSSQQRLEPRQLQQQQHQTIQLQHQEEHHHQQQQQQQQQQSQLHHYQQQQSQQLLHSQQQQIQSPPGVIVSKEDPDPPSNHSAIKSIFRQSSSFDRQNVELAQQSNRTANPPTPGSVFIHGPSPSPAPMSPMSTNGVHSRPESVSSSIEGPNSTVTLKQVQETARQWYLPYISREEAINILKHQPPGSFLVRDSNSFPDAFGLAVKVASLPPKITPKSNDLQSELVRHYLIEPVANKGVRLKGFAQESVFPTLAALIHQHILHAMALPLRLILPVSGGLDQAGLLSNADYVGVTPTDFSSLHDASHRSVATSNTQANVTTVSESDCTQQLGGGHADTHLLTTEVTQISERSTTPKPVNYTLQTSEYYNPSRIGIIGGDSVYNALYLGNYDVNCNDGHRALKAAVDHVLKQIQTSGRHTECQLQVSPTDGITLSDTRRKLFVRRNFPTILITYCSLDPKDRTFDCPGDDHGVAPQAKASCLDGFFKPINDKKHRIFAFIARKSIDMNSVDGTCYVLCESHGSHSASVIVKDVLKTLQGGTSK